MRPVIYRTKGTSELPTEGVTWYQQDGVTLYNFSAGWTFAVRVGNPGVAALATLTAVGTATAPNIIVSFAAGWDANIPQGTYHLDITPQFTALTQDLNTQTWMLVLRNGVAA